MAHQQHYQMYKTYVDNLNTFYNNLPSSDM